MGHPTSRLPKALPRELRKSLPDGRDLLIRNILPADLPTLAEIYVRTYNGKNTGEIWTLTEAQKLLQSIYDRNSALSLLAEVDGKVVGAAFADRKPWERGKVILEGLELFIDPDVQKNGIGTELLLERIHRARVWYGVTDIEVVTFAETEQPQKFYKDLGYEVVRDPCLQIMSGDLNIVEENLRSRSGKEKG